MQQEYEVFLDKHKENNRFFWSLHLASQVISNQLREDDPDLSLNLDAYLKSKFTKKIRRKLDFDKYARTTGILKEPSKDKRGEVEVTTGDLFNDLSANMQNTHQTVVLSEIRALEIYLRKLFIRIAPKVASEKHADDALKEKVAKKLQNLHDNPRYSIPLRDIYLLFPAIEAVAQNTTHKKTENPLLTPANGISCHDAVEFWREVRNLVAHHDGEIHEPFRDNFSEIYFRIDDEDERYQHRPLPIGKQLKLYLRHAVYSLTTCHQMASILNLTTSNYDET